MKFIFQFAAIVMLSILVSSCKKTSLDLPSLVEYQASDGWYEDAFVRLYTADLPSDFPGAELFTHPWFVLKPENSDNVVILEFFTANFDEDGDCNPFTTRNYRKTESQPCGHVSLRGYPVDGDIGTLEFAHHGEEYNVYIRGELRGETAISVVDFILDQSEFYACRDKYQLTSHNSNTYARVMLEDSGFKEAVAMKGSSISLGGWSWGESFWKDCEYEF
ncbi:MAG: hypothetical protein KUG73_03470 [Pseudomonadales bacterium]|nr:hypothetical protein [Pseudomonadales bacterium]